MCAHRKIPMLQDHATEDDKLRENTMKVVHGLPRYIAGKQIANMLRQTKRRPKMYMEA